MTSLLKAASSMKPQTPKNIDTGYLLTVICMEARNLPAADENGFSDPFVEMKVNPESKTAKEAKTQVQKKTLNPKWNETFNFTIHEEDFMSDFQVIVKDWDRFSKSDKLGLVNIPLSKMKKDVVDVRWYKLSSYTGEICLSIHAQHFGRNAFGLVYRTIVPNYVNMQTLDEEQIAILQDATTQSSDELETVSTTLTETERVKQLRQKLAQDINQILQSYPSEIQPKANVDVTLLPGSDLIQVQNILSQVSALQLHNQSTEEHMRLKEVQQRLDLLHSITKALDEVKKQRALLKTKVDKVAELLKKNDDLADGM